MKPRSPGFASLIFMGMSLAMGGCDLAGVMARPFTSDHAIMKASYPGLRGQRVAVIVWADSSLRLDYPKVQPELARGLQEKLQQAASEKGDEVQDVQWVPANKILQFQEEHPEFEMDSAEMIAPRLDVTRLIYVEIGSLSLHPNDGVELTRGVVSVSLKVVEVNQGKGKVAYREPEITASFPKESPPEGLPNLDDNEVYRRTLGAITTEIAQRFVTHEDDAG